MRANAILFFVLAVFFAVSDTIYWFMSRDPTGTTALAFALGLAFLVGYYLQYTARRIPMQPEDAPDADVEDGAGEVGFFSPHSYWPFYLAIGAGVTMLGLVFGWWLFLIGAGMFAIAALGFVFEYYVGDVGSYKTPDASHQ